MRCPKHLRGCSNKQRYYSDCLSLQLLQLPAFSKGLKCIFEQQHPQKRNFCICVRARAITCPIFQCFVCRCEIVSTNCQSSCISKHSYMHNHASHASMHLIERLCYSYTSAIPMLISIKINRVNSKFLLLMTNVYCLVSFKIQYSCQHSC